MDRTTRLSITGVVSLIIMMVSGKLALDTNPVWWVAVVITMVVCGAVITTFSKLDAQEMAE